MKRIILNLFIISFFAIQGFYALAERPEKAPQQENKWMTEVRNFKHSFLISETGMTDEQSKKFLPLYSEMEDKVYSANREARKLEQELTNSQEDADDDKYMAVATALSKVKEQEADIENRYFILFSEILSKKQMFLLKRAENRFAIEMLNHNKLSRRQNSNQ